MVLDEVLSYPKCTQTWLNHRTPLWVELTREQPSLSPVPGDSLDAAIVSFENVDQGNSGLLKSENGDEARIITDESVSEIRVL